MTLRTMMFCLVLTAGPTCAVDGSDILDRVDRNLAPDSYEMYPHLRSKQPHSALT